AAETTMGPMHTASQLQLVRGLVDSAVGSGARVIPGGTRGSALPGHFLPPTVVADGEPGMDLVEQEQFGAALPIVAYDDLDATVAQVNAGDFGLGA
ncbi:aldehyde dehydrogenase family protein, partial [Arthrobacter deserti]|nr:aldehyde dehydrogenase family protein [Arthrobacter deserti]